MDEWTKQHIYIVCATKRWALGQMVIYYRSLPEFTRKYMKINRSKLTISCESRVRQYVSVYQVLHSFDGVDNVDHFGFDETVSNYKTEDIIKCVKILKNAGKRREERAKLLLETMD